LDVAFCLRPDAERLLDVVTASRPCGGEPLGDRLQALDLKADVVDSGEALAAFDAGRCIVLEIEDGEVDVAVGKEDAARPGIVYLADFLHAEGLDVELRGFLDVLGGQRNVLDLRHRYPPHARSGRPREPRSIPTCVAISRLWRSEVKRPGRQGAAGPQSLTTALT